MMFLLSLEISKGSLAEITHGYRFKGTYTPRVVIKTEKGGYFELDTHGKTFVVLDDHPEVSGADTAKSSGILLLFLTLLVTITF